MFHDIGRAVCRNARKKQVYVVVMTLHGEDVVSTVFAALDRRFFEAFLYSGDIEYLPAVSGAEHEVIVQQ